MDKKSNIPTFDELTQVPGNGPIPGCAWIWGSSDQNGTINLLTPSVVQAAREEIQKGISCALNWEMTQNLRFPPSFRCHTKLCIMDASPGGTFAFDDEIHFNPQSGSQIDGLRHYAHQETQTYYNGLRHEEILSGEKGKQNGISAISERGGIVGRGVLLDYKCWADKRGIRFSPVSRHEITIDVLEQIAQEKGIHFRTGDILLVRTGFTVWHNAASDSEIQKHIRNGPGTYVGVEANEASARWLWNHHFAMVASDTMAFEAWPPKRENGIALHEYMIALWGMPIGELWDLERLSEMCEQEKRWTFFFTSAPLNVEGGVSSPPNALCIL